MKSTFHPRLQYNKQRRINRSEYRDGIYIDHKNKELEDEYITIAIDSTGIKVTNRGRWMKDKWNVKKEKIFENTCVAVDVKCKKILSMKVTDENIPNSKALP
jgi:hypothetical protein